MNKKKISIIIPFYNGEVFISSLLDSLKESIILSTHSIEFEIIIVIDSMETHQSVIDLLFIEIFSDISIELLVIKNKKNLGVAGSRNEALKKATGNYCHIIDQDDQVDKAFYPTIESCLDKFNFVLVNGVSYYTNKKYNSHKLFYVKPKLSLVQLLKDDFIRSPGQVVFSKELIQNISFPEPKHHKGSDDRFFWIKIFLINTLIKPHYIAVPLYFAYIHNTNYSSDSLNLRKSGLENWDILMSEVNTNRYRGLIEKDIISLKFAAGMKLGFFEKFSGAKTRFFYFFSINKVVRFYFKRLKFTSKKS